MVFFLFLLLSCKPKFSYYKTKMYLALDITKVFK